MKNCTKKFVQWSLHKMYQESKFAQICSKNESLHKYSARMKICKNMTFCNFLLWLKTMQVKCSKRVCRDHWPCLWSQSFVHFALFLHFLSFKLNVQFWVLSVRWNSLSNTQVLNIHEKQTPIPMFQFQFNKVRQEIRLYLIITNLIPCCNRTHYKQYKWIITDLTSHLTSVSPELVYYQFSVEPPIIHHQLHNMLTTPLKAPLLYQANKRNSVINSIG